MRHMIVLAGLLAVVAVCQADVTAEDQFKVEEDSVARVLAQKLVSVCSKQAVGGWWFGDAHSGQF